MDNQEVSTFGLKAFTRPLLDAKCQDQLILSIIERREKREAEEKAVEPKKTELIVQMGSGVRDVAVLAAEELRRATWLTDGSLRGANLQGADLWYANLRGACLTGANLEGADLWSTDQERTGRTSVFLGELNSFVNAFLPDGLKLGEAGFVGTDVTAEQLAQVDCLAGATLPDSTKLSDDNWEAEFEE